MTAISVNEDINSPEFALGGRNRYEERERGGERERERESSSSLQVCCWQREYGDLSILRLTEAYIVISRI